MADSREYMTLPEENGSINIAEDVIAAIAVGAVREVEGVSGKIYEKIKAFHDTHFISWAAFVKWLRRATA